MVLGSHTLFPGNHLLILLISNREAAVKIVRIGYETLQRVRDLYPNNNFIQMGMDIADGRGRHIDHHLVDLFIRYQDLFDNIFNQSLAENPVVGISTIILLICSSGDLFDNIFNQSLAENPVVGND